MAQTMRRGMLLEALELEAWPTQADFIYSDAVVNGIYSPMGEGKSWSCVTKALRHAARCAAVLGLDEVEGYIIRDTLENCKRSPIPTWRRVLGSLFELKDQAKEAICHTTPLVHLSFFGIADAGGLSKLQGPEPSFIHLEEVCPVEDSEHYSAGLSEDVFNISLARVPRALGGMPLLMVSGNPATREHWFYRRLVLPVDGPMEDDTPLITKRVFKIPYGENQDLKEIARQGVKAAYAHDPARRTRFVEGDFVPVYQGKRVVEAFLHARHVAGEALVPLRGLPGVRGWDGWEECRCVMGQQLPSGQIRVVEVVEDHTDIRALIPKVQARLAHPRWKMAMVPEWRDCGDCTMTRHDQTAKAEKASRVIEDTFGTWFEPGPARWESIASDLGRAFRGSTSDGQPAIVISPECRGLIAGLEGDWHYPKDRGGTVAQKPRKNLASNSCDALANLLSVLQPWQPVVRSLGQWREQRLKQRQRAASYAGPRVVS